ncbi:hypothetical protein THAOC_05837 [Thalassiosira oceanica]|uniref:Uncharacterized protein n=1 Tax=Thalassiosira oceanica TaxID=159749 RepID=K0T699_THAOC|nr:hypothetical protein THAOC_05837 [Thalassiosira oceanica]|eukprot:EJK72614.1 hypothetical protein THAOC_05837 [Thalassiosira oceanica]
MKCDLKFLIYVAVRGNELKLARVADEGLHSGGTFVVENVLLGGNAAGLDARLGLGRTYVLSLQVEVACGSFGRLGIVFAYICLTSAKGNPTRLPLRQAASQVAAAGYPKLACIQTRFAPSKARANHSHSGTVGIHHISLVGMVLVPASSTLIRFIGSGRVYGQPTRAFEFLAFTTTPVDLSSSHQEDFSHVRFAFRRPLELEMQFPGEAGHTPGDRSIFAVVLGRDGCPPRSPEAAWRAHVLRSFSRPVTVFDSPKAPTTRGITPRHQKPFCACEHRQMRDREGPSQEPAVRNRRVGCSTSKKAKRKRRSEEDQTSPAEKKDRKRLRDRARQAKKREDPDVRDRENAQKRARQAKKRED